MDKKELYSDIKILIDKFCNENITKQQFSNFENGYSFKTLLDKFQIKIPIIQRDYAQGREDNNSNYIRKDFLDTIKKALNNGNGLNLDFIYGNINEKNCFEPIDGQQRLTTLFLLYLYLYKKHGRNCNFLEKFSYETRVSSRDFFKTIVKNNLEISSNDDNIKEYIKNSCWFTAQWEQDPTIKACLNTISDIHKIFYKSAEQEINNLEKITFKLLDMGEFNLSDDLYIKMNSRGKHLTDFENLKAQMLQWTENNYKDKSKNFSENLDVKWSNFLWKKVQLQSASKEDVDKLHAKLITIAAIKTLTEFSCNIKSSCFEQNNFANFLDKIIGKSNKFGEVIDKSLSDIFKGKEFCEIFADIFELKDIKTNQEELEKINKAFKTHNETNKIINNIFTIYDLSNDYDEQINNILKKHQIKYEYKDSKTFLYSITDLFLFSDKHSYAADIMFLGQTLYLEALDGKVIDEFDFVRWIRFVRNLAVLRHISPPKYMGSISADSYIRNQRFKNPFILLSKISEYKCNKPFENFINTINIDKNELNEKDDGTKIETFIKNEHKKAKLIKNNPNLEKYINEFENNVLLRGNLGFILNNFIDENGKEKIDLSKLLDTFNKYFTKDNKISADFRMAFLTEGDKSFDFVKNRHNCYTYKTERECWDYILKYRIFANFADIQWCLNEEIEESIKKVLGEKDGIKESLRIKNNFKNFFKKITEKFTESENPCREIINNYIKNSINDDNWIKSLATQYLNEKLEEHVPYIVIYDDKDNSVSEVSYLRIARPTCENDFYKIWSLNITD